jgi:hypothetical protein
MKIASKALALECFHLSACGRAQAHRTSITTRWRIPSSPSTGEDKGEGANLIPLILAFSRKGRRNHLRYHRCNARLTNDTANYRSQSKPLRPFQQSRDFNAIS